MYYSFNITMGRPRKTKEVIESPKEDVEAFEQPKADVIIDEVETTEEVVQKPVITAKQAPQKPPEDQFVRRSKGSPFLYRVEFKGREVWFTTNQIKVVTQSQPDDLVIPDGSPYLSDKSGGCKDCGK